jgi:hypothetical protein
VCIDLLSVVHNTPLKYRKYIHREQKNAIMRPGHRRRGKKSCFSHAAFLRDRLRPPVKAPNAYAFVACAPWSRCVSCGRKPHAERKEAFSPLLLIFERSSIIFRDECQHKSPIKRGFLQKQRIPAFHHRLADWFRSRSTLLSCPGAVFSKNSCHSYSSRMRKSSNRIQCSALGGPL